MLLWDCMLVNKQKYSFKFLMPKSFFVCIGIKKENFRVYSIVSGTIYGLVTVEIKNKSIKINKTII